MAGSSGQKRTPRLGRGEGRRSEGRSGEGRKGKEGEGRGEGLEGQNKGMPYNKHVHLQDECLSID